MLGNYQTSIIFSSLLIISIVMFILVLLRKRKRSAKSIYKLINDLEKKYIY